MIDATLRLQVTCLGKRGAAASFFSPCLQLGRTKKYGRGRQKFALAETVGQDDAHGPELKIARASAVESGKGDPRCWLCIPSFRSLSTCLFIYCTPIARNVKCTLQTRDINPLCLPPSPSLSLLSLPRCRLRIARLLPRNLRCILQTYSQRSRGGHQDRQ